MADTKTKFIYPANQSGPRKVCWPCTIDVPMDGGAKQKLEVDVRFLVLDQDAIIEAYKGGDVSLFDAVVDGFPDHPREGGGTVPDAEAKAFHRAQPYSVRGILDGFCEMIGKRLPKN